MSLLVENDARAAVLFRSHSVARNDVFLAKLLLLSAVGLFFGDIALISVGDFSATPYHILFPLVAVLSLLLSKRHKDFQVALVWIWLAMVVIELAHVVLTGYIMELEWFRSFAQFMVYSLSFLIIIRIKLDRTELILLARWVAKLSIILSSIGVIQYILLSLHIPAYLPSEIRISGFDPLVQTYRYGGFSPAIGFSTEPSHYALALCVLLACLLFFAQAGVLSRWLQCISLIGVMFGILVSYSVSGIIISTVLLAVLQKKGRVFLILLILLFLWLLLGSSFARPIVERFLIIGEGQDASSMMRVVASIRLLFANGPRLETFFFGTGMGLEIREYETYVRVYSQAIPRYLELTTIKVHNILVVVKLFQGWVGLVMYGAMVWLSLRPAIRAWRLYMPLFVFFFLYHFSTGLYLTPAFWSVYALMTVLWKSELTPN